MLIDLLSRIHLYGNSSIYMEPDGKYGNDTNIIEILFMRKILHIYACKIDVTFIACIFSLVYDFTILMIATFNTIFFTALPRLMTILFYNVMFVTV